MSALQPSLYTVEFSQKYVNRTLPDYLLTPFLEKVQKRDPNNYRPHQNLFGASNNNKTRLVHFYSGLTYGDIHNYAKKYAEEKRFGFSVKQIKYTIPTKVFGKGGMISNFLNQTVSINDFKIK